MVDTSGEILGGLPGPEISALTHQSVGGYNVEPERVVYSDQIEVDDQAVQLLDGDSFTKDEDIVARNPNYPLPFTAEEIEHIYV